MNIEDATFEKNGKKWKFVRFCKFNDLSDGDWYYYHGGIFRRGKGFEPRPDDTDIITVVVAPLRWRAKVGEKYCYIGSGVFGNLVPYETIENGVVSDK